MSKLADAETIVEGQTITGVFDTEAAARDAVGHLERAGMPPDRIGLVVGNMRQAREVAGSYSPQGAIAGALVGVLLVAADVIFGGEQMRQSAVAIGLGGFAIVGGLAAIGWLAGRARVFKEREYEELEDESAEGDIHLSVVCDTPDGADATRAILERAGAREVKLQESSESV